MLSLTPSKHWLDQPQDIIHTALHAAQTGKAPTFDIARCVSIAGPSRFLRTLWDAFDAATAASAAHVAAAIEVCRRIATHVLLAPPSATPPGAPPVPPLFPFFYGVILAFLAHPAGWVYSGGTRDWRRVTRYCHYVGVDWPSTDGMGVASCSNGTADGSSLSPTFCQCSEKTRSRFEEKSHSFGS